MSQKNVLLKFKTEEELEEYVQMKDMFRSQREEAEREFELARAEEEEMSEINFKSTFFWDTL